MLVREIRVTAGFERQYARLSEKIKESAKRKEILFRLNPFERQLETHKLHGKDHGSWAFSVDRRYRVKFIFLTADSVLFLEIGTHDIYR